MAAGGNIACECENTERPVDYLGDSVCKASSASVREIIKKYEPDREVAANVSFTSSMASTSSHQRQAPNSIQSHVIVEEEACDTIQASVQHFFPKQTVVRTIEKPLEKKISFINNTKHGDQEQRHSLTDLKSNSSNHQNKNTGDITYQSKTTITKTSTGVRIVTDIQFEKQATYPDNWQGSRIETEIPPSRILTDFQHKNGTK